MRGSPSIRLSPTLARLARRPAAAFTLIELLIALGLSMVIIVIAVSAFRIASRAMTLATELSVENGLLRIGFQASLNDVDYHHSEANDKPPYGKGFTRERTVIGAAPNFAVTARSYIRRHFQPVRFLASTDPEVLPFSEGTDTSAPLYAAAWDRVLNPNVMLAHDWRSIDRSHIFDNPTPTRGYRWGKPIWTHGDYRLVACTDMRFHAGAVPAVAPRSTPRLIDQPFPYGTTASPATVMRDMDGKLLTGPPAVTIDAELTASVVCPVRTTYNQAIPLLTWQIFDRLSYNGMTEYPPLGANSYPQDQEGCFPSDNWRRSAVFTSPRGFPENDQGNRTRFRWLWSNTYGRGTPDMPNFLGCTLSERTSWAVVARPVIAGAAVADCYDYGPSLVQLLMRGNVAGNDTRFSMYDYGWTGLSDTGDKARNDREFTSRTIRLPYNVTDQDRCSLLRTTPGGANGYDIPYSNPSPLDYTDKPAKFPVLTTDTLRYYRVGGTSAVYVTVTTVEDQASGRRVELLCVPYGTTYRGARQHWRLYSPGYAANGAVGDFYDDAPGPFYAP
jgi:hypothetical protein